VERQVDEARDLVNRILAGDAKAFKSLVEQNQRLVSHIVFKMIPNETDREDLSQDVFMRVYRNLGRFEFRSKLSTWIARITYNTCGNYLEKKKIPLYEDLAPEQKTIDSCAGANPLPDEYTEKQEISDRLREEVDMLPIQYKTIITLYHLDEMSYTEIGGIMKLPEGTVKSYLFRARKLLKERLTAKFQPEELWNPNT
jgi:RNA polymerase sigma-70 factor (ECF subfamily)